MKLVHSNTEHMSGRDLLIHARLMEKEGNDQHAIKDYRRLLSSPYRREFSYQRLMVIYRRLKEFKKELAIIDEAIKEFSAILYTSKRLHKKKVESLSRKLSISTGLSGKRGDSIHQPEPVSGWTIRRKRLKKLIEAGK
jgi:tetratricopeptide (TPR) repeat protein